MFFFFFIKVTKITMDKIFDDIKLQIELIETEKCHLFRKVTVIDEIINGDPGIKLDLDIYVKSISEFLFS